MRTQHSIYMIVILSLILSYTSHAQLVDNIYKIPKTKIAPVIDGKEDAVWKTLNWNMQRIYNVGDPPTLSGGADSGQGLTGMSKAMWDANNLYILFYTIDDVIIDIPANPSWNQDGVELFIDGTNDHSTETSLKVDQHLIDIPHWLKDKEVGHLYEIFGINPLIDTTGIEFKIADVADNQGFPGWMTEIKIPLAALGIDGASAANQKIGWELQQDESDDATVGRQSMSKWWSSSNNSWANAGIWGTAILSDRSVDTVFEMNKLPAGTSITIDGQMDPIYRQANAITMSCFRVGDPPESDFADTDPMFGGFITAYPIYDNNNLYLFYDVVDGVITDIPMNPSWNQDGIELFIDGTNDHSTETSLKPDQHLIDIPHWLKDKEVGHLYEIFGINPIIDTTGIQFKITDHGARGNDGSLPEEGRGYNVELKIPLTALGIVGSSPGTKIGLELQLDNANNASVGREGMEKWWSNSNNSWANAGIWGTAMLGSSFSIINYPPAAPQNLIAQAGNTQVTLTWSKNSEADFSKYRIYFGTSDPANILKDSTTHIYDTVKTITGLMNGTKYYFRITAMDSSGLESTYSNEVSVTPIVPSGLLFQDNFTSGAGTLLTNSSWILSGTTNTNPLTIVLPGLTFPNYTPSGIGNAVAMMNNGQDLYRSFPNVNSGSVYLAFMANISAAQTGDYFIAFSPSALQTNYFARLHVKTSGGGFAVGINKQNEVTGGAQYGASIFNLNTTYLFVVKYTFMPDTSNDQISVYVLPAGSDLFSEPSTAEIRGYTAPTKSDAMDLGFVTLRQGSSTAAPTLVLDGIRVATTWQSTIGFSIPPSQPKNLTASAGSGQVLLEWKKNTESDFLKYRIYMGIDSVMLTLKDSSSSSIFDTTKLITGLTGGVKYYFRVSALNDVWMESARSFAASATPYTPSPVGGLVYKIPKTKIVPVIDGKEDAVWKTLNWNMQRIYNVGDPPTPSGAADSGQGLTGMSKAMWDANNLYILFYTIDDVIIDIPANPSWNQDGVELFIDGTNDHSTETSLKIDQHLIEIPHWLKDKEVGHLYEIFEINPLIDTTGIQFKISDVADNQGFPGWMTEIKIPLAALGIDGASAANQKIGWELQQDESDDATVGRQSMSKWWSNSNNSWANAGIWGTAILSDRSVDTVFEMNKLPAGTSITVDGQMDPIYRYANAITMNCFRVGDPPTAEYFPANTDPMFGGFITAYPVYDDSMMYIFYDVVDHVLVDVPANPGWNQDAIGIFIDGTNNKTPETSLKTSQYYFTIPNWMKGVEKGKLGSVFGSSFDTSGVVFKITDHGARGNDGTLAEEGSGYNVEVKIPLAALGIHGSAIGTQLGFELELDNSNDASVGRTGIEKWWNASNNSWANAGIWGTAMLGKMIVKDSSVNPPVTATNEWVNFWSDSTYFEGQPVKEGDVIEAFDPQGVCCGTFTVKKSASYGLMPVYRDDPFTPVDEGAQPGDVITFKINGYPARTNGPAQAIWTANGDVKKVNLAGSRVQSMSLPLQSSWNLVSWNLDTPNDSTSVVLGAIMNKLTVALGFNNGGLTYDPTIPPGFNTLTMTDQFHGYWLKMKDTANLVLSGIPVDATTPILLASGYNLVSYLPTQRDSVGHALGSVMANTKVVLGFENGGLTYDPTIPPEFNSLKVMKQGYGYWIKTTTADTLIYPSTSIVPAMIKGNGGALTKVTQSTSVRASREWISVWGNNVMLHGKLLPTGTTITVKTSSGIVCGVGEVWAAGKFGLISIYKDDATTEVVEGAKEGEEMTLYLGDYRVSKTIKWTNFGDVVNFSDIATGIAELSVLPTEYALQQNYPNPFNPSTTIRYQLPKSSMVTLKIFDMLGREVAMLVNEQKEAGYYEMQWNARNCSSGVYFYTIRAGEYNKTKKLLLVK